MVEPVFPNLSAAFLAQVPGKRKCTSTVAPLIVRPVQASHPSCPKLRLELCTAHRTNKYCKQPAHFPIKVGGHRRSHALSVPVHLFPPGCNTEYCCIHMSGSSNIPQPWTKIKNRCSEPKNTALHLQLAASKPDIHRAGRAAPAICSRSEQAASTWADAVPRFLLSATCSFEGDTRREAPQHEYP